jgi:hypothetical protein
VVSRFASPPANAIKPPTLPDDAFELTDTWSSCARRSSLCLESKSTEILWPPYRIVRSRLSRVLRAAMTELAVYDRVGEGSARGVRSTERGEDSSHLLVPGPPSLCRGSRAHPECRALSGIVAEILDRFSESTGVAGCYEQGVDAVA